MFILLSCILVFLGFRLLVAAYNYYTFPSLRLAACSSNAGLVSVLIPARNEQDKIKRLLDSILLQQGIQYEVIVLDDHSADETYQIAHTFAQRHPKFRVLRGASLPRGWTGKNFACYQLAEAARGRYLLFLDADVVLHPSAISSAVYRMQSKKLSLLSLFSDQQMLTWGEQMTVPLMNYLLLTLLPIRLIRSHADPIFSAACGQFMLFNAEDYQQHQFHRQAKSIVAEDLVIMKMLKRYGKKGEGLIAGGLLQCRMYSGYQDAVDGFSKNFIAPFNNSIPLFLLFLTAVVVGPLLVLASGNLYLISALTLIIVTTRYFSSRLSGQSVVNNILLHPLQMLTLAWIGCLAVQRKLTGSVSWKGRLLVTAGANAKM
ncbi:glycosyltransferase [Pedobacter deserti]|uniref:glycosyltransferase n=1 Tax=Pedobacter deserti TaxID=2817382 RepID=UPI00210E155F|nr:glycosyltransferase family 2 protein [Pedobacter sp. SYSU D00382]